MGSLSCLNVSGGDIRIQFDTADASEALRARRIIKDMLRRGYALLVRMSDGTYQRALDFDETVGEYVIADFDPTTGPTPEEARREERAERFRQAEVSLSESSATSKKRLPLLRYGG
jgi:hypothetical protein